ncbi:MAG: hypothetical protein AAF322_05910 [Pseudomonadota bacterium]
MDTPLSDAVVAQRLINHARQLYNDLTEELMRALDLLRNGEADPEAKGRAETIRSHRKALQTVLEIEVQFVKNAKEEKDELDLHAARDEIFRRLDRLASRGSGQDAD